MVFKANSKFIFILLSVLCSTQLFSMEVAKTISLEELTKLAREENIELSPSETLSCILLTIPGENELTYNVGELKKDEAGKPQISFNLTDLDLLNSILSDKNKFQSDSEPDWKSELNKIIENATKQAIDNLQKTGADAINKAQEKLDVKSDLGSKSPSKVKPNAKTDLKDVAKTFSLEELSELAQRDNIQISLYEDCIAWKQGCSTYYSGKLTKDENGKVEVHFDSIELGLFNGALSDGNKIISGEKNIDWQGVLDKNIKGRAKPTLSDKEEDSSQIKDNKKDVENDSVESPKKDTIKPLDLDTKNATQNNGSVGSNNDANSRLHYKKIIASVSCIGILAILGIFIWKTYKDINARHINLVKDEFKTDFNRALEKYKHLLPQNIYLGIVNGSNDYRVLENAIEIISQKTSLRAKINSLALQGIAEID